MKSRKSHSRVLTSFPYGDHQRLQYDSSSKLGSRNASSSHLYQRMQPFSAWDPYNGCVDLRTNPIKHDNSVAGPSGYGAIFNLEFSTDGRTLAAACRSGAVLLFDAATRRRAACVEHAHMDSVNCVRWLDERLFATCSDDYTVAVWDARNLSSSVKTLSGVHNKWVKNIEYHSGDKVLLSSGMGGDVVAWDLNSWGQDTSSHRRLVGLHNLMRMKLSPDLCSLVLSTNSGSLILLQDLDLSRLKEDMRSLKALRGRSATAEREVFRRRRNRPVILRDFPATNRAASVQSIHIHPQSWAVVSRNTSHHDESEWTCVHDIQHCPTHDGPPTDELPPPHPPSPLRADKTPSPQPPAQVNPRFELMLDQHGDNWVNITRRAPRGDWLSVGRTQPFMGRVWRRREEVDEDEEIEEEDEEVDTEVREVEESADDANDGGDAHTRRAVVLGLNILMGREVTRQADAPPRAPPRPPLDAISRLRSHRFLRHNSPLMREARARVESSRLWRRFNTRLAGADDPRVPNPPGLDNDTIMATLHDDVHMLHRLRHLGDLPDGFPHTLRPLGEPFVLTAGCDAAWSGADPGLREDYSQQRPRLTHHCLEPNVAQGYIKELCFSPDGRLVASPYKSGVRLLAFDDACAEMHHCLPEDGRARQLSTVAQLAAHSHSVVATKFSPTQPLLVSGCLHGTLVWHQPRL